MEGKVCLSEILGNRETLEGISYYTLISLCESMCYEFIALREVGTPLHYSDERAIICDLSSGKIDSDSLNASQFLSGGAHDIAAVKFIAPEILRGEDVDSYRASLYTLAVLLFRIVTLSFPFEGKKYIAIDCEDCDEVKAFYKKGNSFIFNKASDNRATFGFSDVALAFWEIYPQYLKDAFFDTFERGLRYTEEQWLSILKNLKRGLSICTECGAEIFYTDFPTKCWRCLTDVYPYVLKLTDNGRTMLDEMATCGVMYNGGNYKFETVVRNMRWGIKNHLDGVWQWIKPDKKVVGVEKNKAVPLKESVITLASGVVLRVLKGGNR